MSFIKSALLASLLLTGCSAKKQTPPPQVQTNMLGVFKTQPASYAKLSPTSINLHTDDLSAVDDYSGNRTSLLWGLVTVASY
jgi:uncharacterized protein YcfL